MVCPQCRHANPPEAQFCLACGERLELVCTACGAALPPTARFCMACGQPLAAGDAPLPTSHPNGEPALQGERRRATVLFSDLSGYTAMTERLDPEEVQGILARIKAGAVGIVERHGGIVNQFVGDEVLALFGIPAAHEDDPVRAVRAALALHGLVRELSGEVEGRVGRPLRMHTGINTGLVVTDPRDRRDGTVGVTGDAVNTGARLKALAGDDAILLGPETARLAAGFIETEPLPAAALKGKALPVAPFRVVGEAPERSRFEAAARRGLTSFAGREEELARLKACLERAVAGEGQFVTVVGEAGVGKSRLLHEFRHFIDRERITVLEGRCQAYGGETPYLPLLDALRHGLRLHEESDPGALHDRAVAAIRAIDPALEKYLPHLLHLLSIPSPAHPLPPSLQGEALRRELVEALGATITLNTRHGPMVLIYEDWHWADEASDAALKNLLGLVGHYPLLLVVLYRPEYAGRWGEMENHSAIVLHPLDVAETEAMVRSVLGARGLPPGLAAHVHARTGGNALFNEEVSRSLLEEGAVSLNDGAAELKGDLENLHLPDTVHAVIRARVDRLDPDVRDVLRLASVIGREFDRAVLERLFPARQRLAEVLEVLARQDLVHPVRLLPEPAWLFKHVLVQVVVYETLLLQQRKALHEQVAHAIESLYPDRIEEVVESLAYHYSRSDNHEKAIDYLEKAGDKAISLYSLTEARRYLLEALHTTKSLAETPEITRQRIDLALKWADKALTVYEPTKVDFPVMESAIEEAGQLGDTRRQALATQLLGRMHYYTGDMTTATKHFQKCVEWADVLNDEALLAVPLNAISRAVTFTGDINRALAALNEAIPMAERVGILFEVSLSTFYRGIVSGWAGRFANAFRDTDHALEVAEQIPDEFLVTWCTYATAVVRMLHGEWKDTLERIVRAGDMAKQRQLESPAAVCQTIEGFARFMLKDNDHGLHLMESGIRIIENSDHRFLLPIYAPMVAESYVIAGRAGEVEKARKQLLRYLTGNATASVGACRFFAMADSIQPLPDWTKAQAYMSKGLDISRQNGQRWHETFSHLRYAEILHKKGDLERAREQLAEATRLFSEMEMSWWLEQAEGLRARIEAGEPFRGFVPYLTPL